MSDRKHAHQPDHVHTGGERKSLRKARTWKPNRKSLSEVAGNTSDAIADILQSDIVSGKLAVGDRLPNENELARLLNVSRGTVREAVQKLQSRELIRTTRGVKGGSFISHPSSADIQRRLGTGLGLFAGSNIATVELMNEAREMLEIPSAGLAALRHTESDLKALEDSMHAGLCGAGSHHGYHMIIARATGNFIIEMMLQPLFEVLDTKLATRPFSDEVFNELQAEHLQLTKAIASRNAVEAQNIMRKHLVTLRRSYAGLRESE